MKKYSRISSRFREQLKHELESWQADGIINTDQSAAISQRYKLDQTGRETSNILLFAIYIIGSVLVAAGVISFVAAHWDKITPPLKVALIVTFMLVCHIAGFYLWKISAKSPRLGHALIVLGTLVFGANIGLLAQIFHIKANFYNGLFAWAIGAIVMAYVLESIPNAVIAIIVSFIAFCGWLADYPHTLCYYTFVAAAAFLPFAYLRRSVLTFALSLLAIGISVIVCAGLDTEQFSAFLLATAGVGLFYFGLGLLANLSVNFKAFAQPAMVLGTVLTAFNAYFFSFRGLAKQIPLDPIDNWMWIVPVASAYIIAAMFWTYTFRSAMANRRLRPISISVLVSAVLVASVPLLTYLTGGYHLFHVILFNILSLVLAVGLTAAGFLALDRRLFWTGILFTALIITSRFLEYETDLLLKAAVFTACGISLILAGVGFEGYLKKRRLTNE